MIVLDTHAALWLLGEPSQLSSPARKAIEEVEASGNKPILSSQTLYEIARAVFRGRIQTGRRIEDLLADMANRFAMRSVTIEIAVVGARFPSPFPSDPFDRIIAATAMVEGVALVTADRNIRRSRAVRTVW